LRFRAAPPKSYKAYATCSHRDGLGHPVVCAARYLTEIITLMAVLLSALCKRAGDPIILTRQCYLYKLNCSATIMEITVSVTLLEIQYGKIFLITSYGFI
jgi:hypothetical protein